MSKAEPLNIDFEVIESPIALDEEVQRRGKTLFETNNGYPTGVAATIGHIRAMSKFLETNQPFCVIIEDDVRFHKQYNEKMKILEKFMLENEYDILSIGFCSYTVRDENQWPLWHLDEETTLIKNVPIANPWGAQAYIITREYAQKFVNHVNSVDDFSTIYNWKFVTDIVIFDGVWGCRRCTLEVPIVVESPDEQSIAGNNNKPVLLDVVVKSSDFYL
jgi:GR25 family glycosyltransferase involved in LPS biosynthesis